MENINNIYYVYVYLDPRKPGCYNYGDYTFEYEPFYVGKGKDNRMFVHLNETELNTCNIYKFRKIQKIKRELNQEPIIIKVVENLENKISCEKEIELIRLIGRCDLKTGPLVNQTAGGDGIMDMSEETRKKISDKAKINNRGIGNPRYGKHCSIETKQKISDARINKLIGFDNPKAKKLYEYNVKGELVKVWDYIRQFVEFYNYSLNQSRITKVCQYNLEVDKKRGYKTYKTKHVLSYVELNTTEYFKVYVYNNGIGEDNHFFGKHHNEETKEKLRITSSGNTYCLGIKHTEKSKQNMSESKKGYKNPMAKKLYQYDRNNNLIQVFDTMTDFLVAFGIKHTPPGWKTTDKDINIYKDYIFSYIKLI